jgi:hypothetical protein
MAKRYTYFVVGRFFPFWYILPTKIWQPCLAADGKKQFEGTFALPITIRLTRFIAEIKETGTGQTKLIALVSFGVTSFNGCAMV